MKKTVGRLLAFVLIVAVVQGLAMLFLTSAGAEKVFVLPLRLSAEKFKPDNNAYAVYYAARSETADADLIVVGIDPAVAESYDVLGHFTRFVKQYNNLSAVLMPFTSNQVSIANNLLKQTDEERFDKRITSLRETTGLSEDCCDYLGEIFYVNTTMAATKKFNLASYSEDEVEAPLAQCVADAYNETERSALCVVDVSAFRGSFREELQDALPDKKLMFLEICYSKACVSPETHDSVSFPVLSDAPACYFVKNRDLSAFYRYYRFVTEHRGRGRGIALDERFTDYFFVIVNGTETRT